MRSFRGKIVELLAPAGNFEIFESIVQSKCDAVYLGGQAFNMRMIRKGFNFTNEELVAARQLAHEKGKKLYITVNNLIEEGQLEDLKTYLKFLAADVQPDALIVQDMAVVKLIGDLGLNLEIHASVMMNVHNLDMIKVLEKEGVTRVVLSREMTLEQVRAISGQTDVELEYFTHGDMCIAHGSQCYYSAMLFGMSSNRGRCLKPCRWWFDTEQAKRDFPLAVKDLSLYSHLPELLEAGVHSLKIEGRMREKGFITNLINWYGDALDAYIADPKVYAPKDMDKIEETKKRELSAGYAFGKPGASNINTLNEGTGKFYSTGKMFSTPTAEREIEEGDRRRIAGALDAHALTEPNQKKLSVKVQTMDQAQAAIRNGADRIYLAGDVYLPNVPLSGEHVKGLRASMSEGQELFLTTPRMMDEAQKTEFAERVEAMRDSIDGILIAQMGAICLKSIGNDGSGKNLRLVGDYSLNVYNSEAAKWYKNHGLESVTASLELSAGQLGAMSVEAEGLELVVYGQLPAMYFEHDFFEALGESGTQLKLSNEAGTYTILKDQFDRTHLLTTRKLNLTPVMDGMGRLGVDTLRIEAQLMETEEIEAVIKAIRSGTATREDQGTFGALRF